MEEKLIPKGIASDIPVYCAFEEIESVEKLAPNPMNPNQHPNKQISLLGNIIEAQGWRAPITVSRRSGFIVRGEGRYLAAKAKGWTHVPVDWQEYANEADEWADLIADNRLSELSIIDDSLIAEIISGLEDGLDYSLTGYSEDEIGDILDSFNDSLLLGTEDIFDVDRELDKTIVPISQLGDVFMLDGKHRIMCGDTTEESDVLKLMNGSLSQLSLTDPPYNVNYEGKTEDRMTIENDNLKEEDFKQFIQVSMHNIHMASAKGAAAYIFHADSKGLLFREAFQQAGYELRQVLIWAKNTFVMGRQDYHWQHEPILYGWKEGSSHYFIDDRTQSTIMEADKPTRSELHPTMKPIELLVRMIKNSSKTGWLISDFFGGSGSTLIACEQLGRVCYMMEIDERYCDVIIKRYVTYKENKGETPNILLERDGKISTINLEKELI